MRPFDITKKLVIMAVMVAALAFAADTQCGGLEAEESVVNFTGTIVKVIGDVKVRRAAGKDWTAAKQGMEISVEDQIMTGPDSTADIMFKRSGERSIVRILEEADMSLMTVNLDKVTGDSEILLDLAIGHIIIKTDPLKGKSKFEVLTPTSMTAVRGTVFEVNVVRESPLGNEDIAQ